MRGKTKRHVGDAFFERVRAIGWVIAYESFVFIIGVPLWRESQSTSCAQILLSFGMNKKSVVIFSIKSLKVYDRPSTFLLKVST